MKGNGDDGGDNINQEIPPPPPNDNLFREWTVQHDQLLFQNRHEPIYKLASMLGRGLKGVEARLEKLNNVDSPAYQRLANANINNASRRRRRRRHSNEEEEDEQKKKPAFKSITEVLNRIRWDYNCPQEDFTVLHYDRVDDEIVETPFGAPNENVSGPEEMFVFAIPEHRIVAVKYKERVVWDRERRIDHVFGSTQQQGEQEGSSEGTPQYHEERTTTTTTTTIDQVIEHYTEWKEQKEAEEAARKERMALLQEALKETLGQTLYAQFLELSTPILQSSPPPNRREVEEYVTSLVRIFRDAHEEAHSKVAVRDDNVDDDENRLDQDGTLNDAIGMGLEICSELIALTLPQEEQILRELLLSEIDEAMAQIEGGGKPKQQTQKGRGKNQKKMENAHTVLPELRDEDLTETFVKGSGAGGQKVNKTSNRVVLVHEPTQLRVECQDTRSLQQNRKIARKRLQLKLDEFFRGSKSKTSVKAAKKAKKKSKSKARSKARLRKKQESAAADAAAAATQDADQDWY